MKPANIRITDHKEAEASIKIDGVTLPADGLVPL
jgi:hypothetical protein